jgi:hypothetical protein
VPDAQGTANVTVKLHDNGGTANGGLDTSLPFQFTISFRASSAWHNPDKPLDVDDDKGIRPIDALFIINHLNAVGITLVPFDAPVQKPFLDTNNDGFVTPIDALLVINELNAGGGAEGEAPAAFEVDDFDIAWLVDVWEAKKK